MPETLTSLRSAASSHGLGLTSPHMGNNPAPFKSERDAKPQSGPRPEATDEAPVGTEDR